MNPQSLLLLGRQPALGLAELERLYGADAVSIAGRTAAIVDADPASIAFARLGGSVKLGYVLQRLPTADWDKAVHALRRNLPDLLKDVPDGKLKLGLSAYGFDVSAAKIAAAGLTLKKTLRNTGRSVRVVPNQQPALNSAQVLHNGLTTPTGLELLAVRDGSSTLLARTIAEQDIDAYAARDQGRPKRDARVGMLPPKLAQIIVNLAVGRSAPARDAWLLDPFCGTGVILQEALLMGYPAAGSDIDQRMGDYSLANLDWLRQAYPATEGVGRSWQLGDATSHRWHGSVFTVENGEAVDAKRVPLPIGAVASETYLGQPFTALPSPEKLAEVRTACNLILKKFLRNLAGQLPAGTGLCLAVPAWQSAPGRFLQLPLLQTAGNGLDHLEDMGYNRVSFKHVKHQELIYARPGQVVARQLLVLSKA